MGGSPAPFGVGPPSRVPTLVMDGGASPDWQRHARSGARGRPSRRAASDPGGPGSRARLRGPRARARGVLPRLTASGALRTSSVGPTSDSHPTGRDPGRLGVRSRPRPNHEALEPRGLTQMDHQRRVQVVLGEAERTDGLLRFVLEAEGFDIVGLASDDHELVRVLRGARPAVVVLDGGISAAAAVEARNAPTEPPSSSCGPTACRRSSRRNASIPMKPSRTWATRSDGPSRRARGSSDRDRAA